MCDRASDILKTCSNNRKERLDRQTKYIKQMSEQQKPHSQLPNRLWQNKTRPQRNDSILLQQRQTARTARHHILNEKAKRARRRTETKPKTHHTNKDLANISHDYGAAPTRYVAQTATNICWYSMLRDTYGNTNNQRRKPPMTEKLQNKTELETEERQEQQSKNQNVHGHGEDGNKTRIVWPLKQQSSIDIPLQKPERQKLRRATCQSVHTTRKNKRNKPNQQAHIWLRNTISKNEFASVQCRTRDQPVHTKTTRTQETPIVGQTSKANLCIGAQ